MRLCHWLNAAAMIVVIMSGWAIHNACPVAPFLFPESAILGGGLIRAGIFYCPAMHPEPGPVRNLK